MRQPYLDYVLDGRKTIESRLTKNRISPFQVARSGDLILFKESGGPIRGAATVARAEFFTLADEGSLVAIVRDRRDGLSYDPGYLESKVDARCASFLHLADVTALSPIQLEKRSRQSWVTVNPSLPTLLQKFEGGVPETCAVLFSGDLAGGKSSVGQLLATRLGVPRLSFGSLVRAEAIKRGRPANDRRVLQDIGEQLVEDLGPDGLVAALINVHSGSAVIEGVRHVDVLDSLLAQYRSAVHVHLTASADELERRWQRRSESLTLKDAIGHSTEAEIPALKNRSHLSIDTTDRSPELVVATILAYLGAP